MARRRLQTILATTALATGLSAVPAWAGPGLGELTGPVEDSADTLTETTEEVVGTVTGTATGEPTDEGSGAPADQPTTEDVAAEDDPALDVGDGALEVDLDADLAPSDEDGSRQFEIDGGLTVAEQRVDVGSATDPLEEVVDPDPPATGVGNSGTERTDGTDRSEGTGGGFQIGGGVVAAGDDPRPADGSPAPDSAPASQGPGQGLAAFGVLHRGSFGVQRHGGGTMALERVRDPAVAAPLPEDVSQIAPAAPDTNTDTTATLATGTTPDSSDSPVSALLRLLAAALVLATGATWTRATRRS